MIGSRLLVATLVFSLTNVAALSNNANNLTADELVADLRNNPYVVDGRYEAPVEKFCGMARNWLIRPLTTWLSDYACEYISGLATDHHQKESVIFCTSFDCDAKYDPVTGLCQCSWGKPEQMIEEKVWSDKGCKKDTTCYAPYQAHWNPSLNTCACAIETFPKLQSAQIVFEPNPMKELLYGASQNKVKAPSIEEQLQTLAQDVREIRERRKNAVIESLKELDDKIAQLEKLLSEIRIAPSTTKMSKLRKRRAVGPTTVSLAPLPTYIPPPNTEVTQELLQESLLIQPQQLATVGSVIPQFADGLITFLVQLDGPISQTLALNAPDTLPCETIGTEVRPNLILVPQHVKNGSSETVLPDCLVIAANVYNPKYITYWVQKADGSVYSLLSDNKIHGINQLDTSLPASVAIRVAPVDDNMKRDVQSDGNFATLKRRQIFSINCDRPCPFYHMDRINGGDGYCGCMFKGADEDVNLAARGVEEPSRYTATMTSEACAAMTCINNGGKPALFNPFTATCWCASPTFVEVNDNAYDGGM